MVISYKNCTLHLSNSPIWTNKVFLGEGLIMIVPWTVLIIMINDIQYVFRFMHICVNEEEYTDGIETKQAENTS